MPAIRKALVKGYAIELDVQRTKDNVIVLFHDYNLLRMTGHYGLLKNTTYEELKNFHLKKTPYKIPSLKEVLDLVQGKVFLDIELKSTEPVGKLERELVKLLDSYSGEFSVKSFRPQTVLWFKRHRPSYRLGLLIEGLWFSLLTSRLILQSLKPTFLGLDKDIFPNKKILSLRRRGYLIIPWTINSKKEQERLMPEADYFLVDPSFFSSKK